MGPLVDRSSMQMIAQGSHVRSWGEIDMARSGHCELWMQWPKRRSFRSMGLHCIRVPWQLLLSCSQCHLLAYNSGQRRREVSSSQLTRHWTFG